MSAKIHEGLSIKDYDATIIALFGSFEKYRNSHQLREVLKRIAYITDIKAKLQQRMDDETANIKWWDGWNRSKAFLVKKLAYPTLFKELDDHIERYEDLRSLPVRMLIDSANEKFDKTWSTWGRTIRVAGVEEYKND